MKGISVVPDGVKRGVGATAFLVSANGVEYRVWIALKNSWCWSRGERGAVKYGVVSGSELVVS